MSLLTPFVGRSGRRLRIDVARAASNEASTTSRSAHPAIGAFAVLLVEWKLAQSASDTAESQPKSA
jgi:hypothetical protein